MRQSKDAGRKNLLEMVKDLLGRHGHYPEEIPTPPETGIVEQLIEKASGEKLRRENGDDRKGEKDGKDGGDKGDGDDDNDKNDGSGGKKGCPYATKRAIVESLHEIRRFAEEHDLAATVIKALLSLLAEMAIGALKGRVSGKVLETLWKAMNYEADRKEAFKAGEKHGRNARINTEYFVERNDSIPDINGALQNPSRQTSIFDIAKESRL